MDTLRNATATILGEGTATSLLGPSTTASTTEESQSGLEPISGETGSGTAEEPYDAGNKEDPEVGGAAAQHTDTTTGTSDAAIGSSTGASGSTSSEPASSSDVRESDSTTVGETGGDVVGGAKTNESARDSDESAPAESSSKHITIPDDRPTGIPDGIKGSEHGPDFSQDVANAPTPGVKGDTVDEPSTDDAAPTSSEQPTTTTSAPAPPAKDTTTSPTDTQGASAAINPSATDKVDYSGTTDSGTTGKGTSSATAAAEIRSDDTKDDPIKDKPLPSTPGDQSGVNDDETTDGGKKKFSEKLKEKLHIGKH